MNQPPSNCELCSNPIDDLILALVQPDTDEPVHFECVLQAIREHEHLEPGEQICYVGCGVFGILRAGRSSRSSKTPERIRKRIPYESETAVPDWRRGLSSTLTTN